MSNHKKIFPNRHNYSPQGYSHNTPLTSGVHPVG